MMGSMNCCGELSTFTNMEIVVGDADKAAKAWARLFDFVVPKAVDGETSGSLHALAIGAFHAFPPLYRGKVWQIPTAEHSQQYSIPQKKYAFDVKTAGENNYAREAYDRYGNGVISFGYSAGEARNYMVGHLCTEYDCKMINYMKYGDSDPFRGDWTAMDTEELLGVNLVLKNDGWSQRRTFALMDDFNEVTLVVPSLRKAAKYWGNIFGLRTPITRTYTVPVQYKGKQSELVLKAAKIDEGAFRICLIEAGETGPFADFVSLRKNGGVYHVTLEMDQNEIDEIASILDKEYGVGTLLAYDLDGTHYTVFDSKELLGVNLALYV